MSKYSVTDSQVNRWQNPAVYFTTFLLIAMLSETVSIFLSLAFLRNGATGGITPIYGVMNGFANASLTLTLIFFVAKQHVEGHGWKAGSLIFLTCLLASVALSMLTMRNAFVYHTFNWPMSFWILGLQIVGLLALYFLGRLKFDVSIDNCSLFDSEVAFPDDSANSRD